MLERAPSCLEPAAQHFLRSIEAPARTSRILPQFFWHHTRVENGQTSWWQAYLNDIRRAACVRDGISVGNVPSHRSLASIPSPSSPYALGSETAVAFPNWGGASSNRRYISESAKHRRTEEDQAFENVLEANHTTSPPLELNLLSIDGVTRPRKLRARTASIERLQALLRSSNETKFDDIWSIFISLEQQSTHARPVLRHLSRSVSPINLRRALRTFQIIDAEDRTNLTYESAVRAAIGLRNYGKANEVVLEALKRGIGVESSQLLMGHLVKKGMWKAARQTLQVFCQYVKAEPVIKATTNHHVLQNLQEAPLWKAVDQMLSLPQKLLDLAKRLQDGDVVLASDYEDVSHLAAKLLTRALRSATIMGRITPEGVLALFNNYQELGLLRLQHYLDAINSLRELRNSRNRSDLALLIFRNMRWHYPDYKLKDSAYGAMISILSAAPSEPDSFDYILQDVTNSSRLKEINRKIDLAMYQRVMSACAKQGHAQYVQRLLDSLIYDHGMPKDLAYFKPLLLSSAKRGDIEGTKASFDKLSSLYGLTPDNHCWNILLLAHAKADDTKGGFDLFNQMNNLDIPADSYTFGTLMSMCSNAGDTQTVLRLVEMARQRNIPASTAMIDTIVHSYCINNETTEAENLVEATTQLSLAGSSTRMWNTLLRHYAFGGDYASVLRTQERMRELAVKPDAMTYAALMTSLVVVRKTKDAAAILRSLHLNQLVTASRFHYSIVFHGYVQEGRRDEAMIIYEEMVRRFSKPSPSAKLAMLHLQGHRDAMVAEAAPEWTGKFQSSSAPTQRHSINAFANVLFEMSEVDSSTDEPQPGFQRRKPATAYPAVYLEALVAMLNNSSSYAKGEELVSRYQTILAESVLSARERALQTIQLRAAQVRGLVKSWEGSGKSTSHLKAKSLQQIDHLWTQVYDQAISVATERYVSLLDPSLTGPPFHESPGCNENPSESKDSTVGVATSEPSTPPDHIASADDPVKVIPAKRHILSIPLSIYMRGLALQNRLDALDSVVKQLQDIGFELTSKNWNTYIQLLSENDNSVVRAFDAFEQKLLPQAPSWDLLKRGKILFSPLNHASGPESKSSENPEQLYPRQTIQKTYPGYLTPSYFTAIHLAAALIKAYRKITSNPAAETSLYDDLRHAAPNTIRYLEAMPYLKDRVQGVLLRGRSVKGDLFKKLREPRPANREGLLGSQSLLEGISLEQSDILENSENMEEDLQRLAEQREDPVVRRALISAKRKVLETSTVDEQRTQTRESILQLALKMLTTEVRDKRPRILAEDAHGDLHVEGLPVYDDTTAPNGLNRDKNLDAQSTSEVVPSLTPATLSTYPANLFRNNIKRLRALASEPEPARVHGWFVRRSLRKTPRILKYASQPDTTLFRPMGDYRHKDPLFTKPLLTMRIPRRQELGRERRAFDRSKTHLMLKKLRQREIHDVQVPTQKKTEANEPSFAETEPIIATNSRQQAGSQLEAPLQRKRSKSNSSNNRDGSQPVVEPSPPITPHANDPALQATRDNSHALKQRSANQTKGAAEVKSMDDTPTTTPFAPWPQFNEDDLIQQRGSKSSAEVEKL